MKHLEQTINDNKHFPDKWIFIMERDYYIEH